MLPSGPRSTYPLPSRPMPGARQLAQQVLATIQGRIAAANSVAVGAASVGCDGLTTINPLNGTTCAPAPASDCSLVLYNPARRAVLTTDVGRALSGSLSACQPGAAILPATVTNFTAIAAPCVKERAALRKKRRFVDNAGNIYGPDGELLPGTATAAVLETDYVHVYGVGVCLGPGS